MKLRLLEMKDRLGMLEWMHDSNVIEKMYTDFGSKTVYDCERFIQLSRKMSGKDLHLAVVDEDDIYQGTVSLKNINTTELYAEFAIVMRSCSMGNGSAVDAMHAVLNIAKERLHLKTIYWCVRLDNIRAIRFYNKNGFQKTEKVPDTLSFLYKGCQELLWYIWKAQM